MGREIRLQLGDRHWQGAALTAPQAVDGQELWAAIREGDSDGLAVDCPQPGLLYEHIGHIHPEMGLRTRTALARAGRTRELTTEHDDEIDAVESELVTIRKQLDSLEDDHAAHRAEYRQAVAETDDVAAKKREAVATARGRLQTRRENNLETKAAVEQLREEIRELSEHQTNRTAATEQLEHARAQARKRRDLEEKRLQLQDRRANLQRTARASLVEQLREAFVCALEAVPGTGAIEHPFETPPPVAALAIARLGEIKAPIVLDSDRFDTPRQASDWLDTPVIQL